MSEVAGGFLVLPPRSWLDMKCFLRQGRGGQAGWGIWSWRWFCDFTFGDKDNGFIASCSFQF